jgi:hypothetical protein
MRASGRKFGEVGLWDASWRGMLAAALAGMLTADAAG